MALWRGFKQYAVDLAVKVRGRLSLSPFERLDVRHLAAMYDLPIVSFDQMPAATEAVRHYTQAHRTMLSGLVVPVNGQQGHLDQSRSLRRADHLDDHARGIALPPLSSVDVRLTGEETCLSGDPEHEEEATWLGGELLVPREAARRLVFCQISEEEAAVMYGVSIEMARWRMNICGARQMQRHSR